MTVGFAFTIMRATWSRRTSKRAISRSGEFTFSHRAGWLFLGNIANIAVDNEPKFQNWWTTLPGVLTAAAGIITAVAGLIVALNQAGVFKPTPVTQPTYPTEPVRPTPPSLGSPNRLPAPISEIAETPTPTGPPAQSANRQLRPGGQWRNPESGISASPQPSPKPTPLTQTTQQRLAHFAGTWTGNIKLGIAGKVQFTLTVNPDATSLEQKSKAFGEHTHVTSYTGRTLSWKAGLKNEIAWTLRPNRDGQTALVTAESGSEINGAAIFYRVQPNPPPAQAKSSPKKHPGTKLKRPPSY